MPRDRKSTRLNSSHLGISYAVFCLKKKKKQNHSKRSTNRRGSTPNVSAQEPSGPGGGRGLTVTRNASRAVSFFCFFFFFFLKDRPPPNSPLFPPPAPFRS